MVKGDQCVHGLVCPEGHPLQERTVFLSNSLMLVQPLAKFCKGKHKLPHRRIEGSVKGHRLSTWSQAWPKRMCSLIAGQIMRLRSAQQTYPAKKFECEACNGQKRKHSLIPGHCAKAPPPADEPSPTASPSTKRSEVDARIRQELNKSEPSSSSSSSGVKQEDILNRTAVR